VLFDFPPSGSDCLCDSDSGFLSISASSSTTISCFILWHSHIAFSSFLSSRHFLFISLRLIAGHGSAFFFRSSQSTAIAHGSRSSSPSIGSYHYGSPVTQPTPHTLFRCPLPPTSPRSTPYGIMPASLPPRHFGFASRPAMPHASIFIH